MIAPSKNINSKATGSARPAIPLGKIVGWSVCIIAIAVVCLVVALLLNRKDDSGDGISKVAPSKHKTTITEAAPVGVEIEAVTNQVVEALDPNKRYEGGVEVVSSSITTNAQGITVERLVLANGKRKKKVRHPKPVFEFSSDDLIAMAISVKPGESMPPMPIDANIDKEFAASLLSPIRINDDDSDEVKEIKARVIETRAYLAEEIKRGGSVYQALMDHQNEQNRIADNRLMAIQEMQKVRAEMGEDAANEFRDRVNESFRIRGIPEIGKKPTEQEN